MGFNDLLKKLFGNKSQRDLKEIEPYIQKIKAISPELEKLSNDELRHRIDVVKQHIQDSVADDRKRIAELKEHVETLDYDKRESTWEEIDKIEKEILKKTMILYISKATKLFMPITGWPVVTRSFGTWYTMMCN